ncbi:Uncharacterised protein [Mycobacteroides abscessus subsp. abscessus]|nr:Uncharacterised protein [Mycobacteroides abscessus subsp. abscessus]
MVEDPLIWAASRCSAPMFCMPALTNRYTNEVSPKPVSTMIHGTVYTSTGPLSVPLHHGSLRSSTFR